MPVTILALALSTSLLIRSLSMRQFGRSVTSLAFDLGASQTRPSSLRRPERGGVRVDDTYDDDADAENGSGEAMSACFSMAQTVVATTDCRCVRDRMMMSQCCVMGSMRSSRSLLYITSSESMPRPRPVPARLQPERFAEPYDEENESGSVYDDPNPRPAVLAAGTACDEETDVVPCGRLMTSATRVHRGSLLLRLSLLLLGLEVVAVLGEVANALFRSAALRTTDRTGRVVVGGQHDGEEPSDKDLLPIGPFGRWRRATALREQRSKGRHVFRGREGLGELARPACWISRASRDHRWRATAAYQHGSRTAPHGPWSRCPCRP